MARVPVPKTANSTLRTSGACGALSVHCWLCRPHKQPFPRDTCFSYPTLYPLLVKFQLSIILFVRPLNSAIVCTVCSRATKRGGPKFAPGPKSHHKFARGTKILDMPRGHKNTLDCPGGVYVWVSLCCSVLAVPVQLGAEAASRQELPELHPLAKLLSCHPSVCAGDNANGQWVFVGLFILGHEWELLYRIHLHRNGTELCTRIYLVLCTMMDKWQTCIIICVDVKGHFYK